MPLFLKDPSSSQIFPWGYVTLLPSTHHLPLVCICKCTRLQCTQLLQLEQGVVSFVKIAGVSSPSFLLFLLSCFVTNHSRCSSLKTEIPELCRSETQAQLSAQGLTAEIKLLVAVISSDALGSLSSLVMVELSSLQL